MNSRESTYYRKPQYKDRDTRQEDYYDDRWEERQGHDHDTPRDNFRSYGGEVQSSMERSGGDREYSDNPRRVYIEKSLNSDQSRRSPLKRHSLSGISPEKYMDREYPRFEERDEEIVRKQRQLQMIEEEIARKKSAIKFLSSETERCISEKKRRRFTEDDDDFKYGESPDDSEYRQSSDHMYRENDFPCRQPPRDDLSYQKTSRDSKHRNQPEDFTYNQPSDDSTYRKSPAHYKDRHFQDCSNDEDTQSDQFFSRADATPRERDYSPSSDYEDHRQNSLRYERNTSYERVDAIPRERDYSPSSDYEDHRRNSLRHERNTSYERLLEDELDVTGQGPGCGERPQDHNAAAKGFERFLGLLNKGVNVDKLIHIVGQSPAVADDPVTPRLNAEKPLWSDRTTSQQERQSYKLGWSESQGSPCEVPQEGRGSQLPRQKTSYRSFQKCSQSDEKSLNKSSVEGNYVSSRAKSPRLVEKMLVRPVDEQKSRQMRDSSRAKSPRLVEKMLVRPVDEQKSRQMRDLLQVIGMDLGFEELGQMSSRIQERLYGKKDDFEKNDNDLRRERRVSSRHHSRSLSSSRSSFGPLTQNVSQKKESTEIPKDKEVKQHTFNDESSKHHVQDNDKYGNNKSQNCSVAFQSFSHSPSYSVSKPPPTPVIPAYDSMSKPPPTPVTPAYHSISKPPPTPPYPPPPFLPYTYSAATPAMPPNWGIQFGMMPPVPFVPGYPPYPSVPNLNAYQAPSSQVNTLFQPTIHRQLIHLSCPTQNQNPVQLIQKSKTSSRPRCLQVIEMGQSQQVQTKTD